MELTAQRYGQARDTHGSAPQHVSLQHANSGSCGRDAHGGNGPRIRGGYNDLARRPNLEGAPRDGRPVKHARFAQDVSRAPGALCNLSSSFPTHTITKILYENDTQGRLQLQMPIYASQFCAFSGLPSQSPSISGLPRLTLLL